MQHDHLLSLELDSAARPPREGHQVSPAPMAALGLAVGVGLGLELDAVGPPALLTLAWCVSVLGLAMSGAARAAWLTPATLLMTAVVGGIALGVSASSAGPTVGSVSRHLGEARLVVVRVAGPTRNGREGRRAALVELERVGPPGGALEAVAARAWMVLDAEEGRVLEVGDRLVARARLRAPRTPRFPRDFDERGMLRLRGADWVLRPIGRLAPLPASPGWGARLLRALDGHRQRAAALLAREGASSGLLPALALGEGGAVEVDVRERFSRCGLSHVLAVSGLHFGLVAVVVFGALSWLLRRVRWVAARWGAERVAAAVAIPVMGLYVLFVGAPVSARRAFVMALCLFGGRALGREGHSSIALSLAALVLLAREPLELYSPGFQLSFAAVLGLLWTGARVERPARRWMAERAPRLDRAAGWLVSSLLATLGASLTTAPLVLYHFGQLPLVGMVANVWVVPVVSFALLPLALLSTALVEAGPEAAREVAGLGGWVEARLVESVTAFEGSPGIVWDAPGLPLGGLIASGVVAALLLHAPGGGRRLQLVTALGCAALALALGVSTASPPHTGSLRVSFLPVGQGDAVLIESPAGEVTLVDGGGDPRGRRDPGADLIVPYLRSQGYHRIDRVILTHPDADHVGGLASVVRAMRPAEVWTNGQPVEGAPHRELMRAAEAVGATHRRVDTCARPVDLGGARLEVLWPDAYDASRGANDNSLVLRLDHGAVSFLLTGDLEAEGERALLRSGAPLGATVLKLGHHGSQTSSTPALLDAVQPALAVITVGARNRYGLPSAPVLRRLAAREVSVFRTDLDGLIRIESDGARAQVSTWR